MFLIFFFLDKQAKISHSLRLSFLRSLGLSDNFFFKFSFVGSHWAFKIKTCAYALTLPRSHHLKGEEKRKRDAHIYRGLRVSHPKKKKKDAHI